MTLSEKAEGSAQNWPAKHFELCHVEVAISDAVGQPAGNDPIQSCNKETVVTQWQNHEKLLISS